MTERARPPNEHEKRCLTCGELFDMRDLGDVLEHENCEGWEPHEATCDECGASTHTNGEIVQCDSCTWWTEIPGDESQDTEVGQ